MRKEEVGQPSSSALPREIGRGRSYFGRNLNSCPAKSEASQNQMLAGAPPNWAYGSVWRGNILAENVAAGAGFVLLRPKDLLSPKTTWVLCW